MNQVLFFGEKEKRELIAYINNQLKIKNRLLGLIISNPNKKTSHIERGRKVLKYEQQIAMLQNMLNLCMSIKSRDGIKQLNVMIDTYNSLEILLFLLLNLFMNFIQFL